MHLTYHNMTYTVLIQICCIGFAINKLCVNIIQCTTNMLVKQMFAVYYSLILIQFTFLLFQCYNVELTGVFICLILFHFREDIEIYSLKHFKFISIQISLT